MAAVEVEGLAGRSHRRRLLLLLLLFVNLPHMSDSLYLAVMEPNAKVNVIEGERIEVNCTLTSESWKTNCSASNMSIRLYRSPEYLTVGEQRPVSQFTVSMVIESTSTNLSGRCYCYCHNTLLTARFPTLIIGAPPHQPEITRIVLENLKILVVYFDPVRDLESLNINTTWSLITSGLGIIRTTPCDVQEEYVCQTSDTFHLIGAPNGASVTITAENEYGNSSTTERQVKVEEYVQLYPVAVKTERVNSTWVQLYWTIEMTLEMHSFGGIHYNLSFQSDFFQPVLFNFTCEVTYAVQNEGCRTIRKVVGGLQPYTDYNLTWQSHPVKKGYWSKPATTQFQTLEDVPKSAPPIQAWQYSYVRELDNTHRTFIYPQDLRPEDKAGVITEYKYLVEGEAEPRRAKGSPRSLTIDSYDPEGPGMAVYLWACTRMGCSKNSSTIILPGAADREAGPSWLDVEAASDGHHRLHWASLQPSSQVQLHWCWGSVVLQNQASLVSCLTGINSTEVDSTATNASLTVPGTEDACEKENRCSLQFGLSVDRDGHSSGIIWNTCIFDEGKEPELVSEVTVDSRQAPREVKLTWQYPCQASPQDLRGRPVSYQSRIGRSAGLAIDTASCDKLQGPEQSSPARHGENSHLYQADLQTGEDYLVCVRPRSSSPHGTAPWRLAQFTIGSKSDMSWQIVVGVVVPIIVIGPVLVVIFWKCGTKFKNRHLLIRTFRNASYTGPALDMGMEAENDIPPSVELQYFPVSASTSPSSLQDGSVPAPPSSQKSGQSIAPMTEDLSTQSTQDSSANSHSNSSASVDPYQLGFDDSEPERNCNLYLKQTGQQTDI